MAHEANPYGGPVEQETNDPGPAPKRKLPRVAVIGALAGIVVLGGAGLAFAEGGHGASPRSAAFASTPATTTPPGSSAKGGRAGAPGPFPRFRMGGQGLGARLGGVVHGQFTVRSGGSYKTIDVQSGQVSEVSSASITVKSSDGFKQTYAVVSSTRVDAQSTGISSVKVNDQVEVVATPQGSTQTATSITDSTLLRSTKVHFGLAPGGHAGGNGTAGFGAPAGGPSAPQ